jgi:hypothetical protein
MLAMFSTGKYLHLKFAVAWKLIRDYYTRHILQAFQQLLEEAFGCFLIAPELHRNIQLIILLVNR